MNQTADFIWISPVFPRLSFFWSRIPHCIQFSDLGQVLSLLGFHDLTVLRHPDHPIFIPNCANSVLGESSSAAGAHGIGHGTISPDIISVQSLHSAILVGMLVGCQAPNSHSGWIFLGRQRRENPAGLGVGP